MYIGYLLSEKSRNELMRKFPPIHPDVIGEHVTHTFGGVNEDTPLPEQPTTAQVIGGSENDKVQCLIVRIDGSVKRPDGKTFHITWSIDRSRGARPVDSNTCIIENGIYRIDKPIDIELTPKLFK